MSPDQCMVDRLVRCDEGDGVWSEGRALTEDHGDGDLLVGTMVFGVFDDVGPLCTSEYAVEYERQ